MPLVSLAVLACIVLVGYKLYYAPFMRHQALYAVGALCIYWFSVSGELQGSPCMRESACLLASSTQGASNCRGCSRCGMCRMKGNRPPPAQQHAASR